VSGWEFGKGIGWLVGWTGWWTRLLEGRMICIDGGMFISF
jgi:hypothetical protein